MSIYDEIAEEVPVIKLMQCEQCFEFFDAMRNEVTGEGGPWAGAIRVDDSLVEAETCVTCHVATSSGLFINVPLDIII